MDLQKMREAWHAKIEAAKSIRSKADAEKRELTEDEFKAIDTALAEAKTLRAQIDKVEARQKTLGELDDAAAIAAQSTGRQVNPADLGQQPGLNIPSHIAQAKPWQKILSSTLPRKGFTANRAFATEEIAREAGYRAGMWTRAVFFSDTSAAAWCKEHGVPVVRGNFSNQPEIGAVMGGSNLLGEYLVPDEMSAALIVLRETYGVARQIANVMPMSRETLTINKRNSGITIYPVGRVLTSTVTAADMSLTQIELNAKTWAGLTLISMDLADDAVINLAEMVADELAYAFAQNEDDCYFNGDGTSTYAGIYGIRPKMVAGLGGASELAGAFDAASNNDTFGEITATDICGLIGTLPAYALPNARFVVSSVGWALVFQRLAAALGGNTLQTIAGPAAYGFLGFPVTIAQKMPTSTGDLSDLCMIAFGDFRLGTVFGDRMQFSVQMLRERYAELRQIGVIAASRFDIAIHGLGTASAAGPVVGLIGE